MTRILARRVRSHKARRAATLVVAALSSVVAGVADALPVYTGTTNSAISFGVAPLGAPISPGVPTYAFGNVSLRNDILTNPGAGLTANPAAANNTSQVGPAAFGPGVSQFLVQVGGGNGFGPFGSGALVINGPTFNYRLSDGGIPGGVSSSYEIATWRPSFVDPVGTPVGAFGNFITFGGNVPLVQDVALVSLRTLVVGNTIGAVEVPGLILAIERNPGNIYSVAAIQDNAIPGVTPMAAGAAIIIDNPITGAFRGLAFNVFPDLGIIDGLTFPAGEILTATVTATVYSDPSSLSLLDPFDPTNADLIAAAVASQGTPFPTSFLIGYAQPVPEPAAISMALVGLVACGLYRKRN